MMNRIGERDHKFIISRDCGRLLPINLLINDYINFIKNERERGKGEVRISTEARLTGTHAHHTARGYHKIFNRGMMLPLFF
ncbi:hypothetical protein D7S44_16665 [Pantoea piersonii]|nr:hypothetical protein D7S44_16665 [Pantoea piersonii]